MDSTSGCLSIVEESEKRRRAGRVPICCWLLVDGRNRRTDRFWNQQHRRRMTNLKNRGLSALAQAAQVWYLRTAEKSPLQPCRVPQTSRLLCLACYVLYMYVLHAEPQILKNGLRHVRICMHYHFTTHATRVQTTMEHPETGRKVSHKKFCLFCIDTTRRKLYNQSESSSSIMAMQRSLNQTFGVRRPYQPFQQRWMEEEVSEDHEDQTTRTRKTKPTFQRQYHPDSRMCHPAYSSDRDSSIRPR